MRIYDAHNHLQDERLASYLPGIMEALEREEVAKMVVNGSREEDWPAVLGLARKYPQVIPSFGYHPWYVKERSGEWESTLLRYLNECRSAVGEIGLDRWIKDFDLDLQREVFVRQLQIAADRNLPVSIHCLQAWGHLLELLRAGPVPQCGFVLHSFGGPEEMIGPLAELGAYFSLPGYFAHERKARQREAFRRAPIDRLLIETDAPDQSLPESRVQYPLFHPGSGKPLNHPANLSRVYEFAAELLDQPLEALTNLVEENFLRVFGGLLVRKETQR